MKWKYILLFVLLISLFPLGTYFYFQNRYQKIVVTPNKNTEVTPSPTPTPDPDRTFSILLLGYGGAGHDGAYLTDSIILARIIPRQQQIDLISLPRDLWVSIPSSLAASLPAKINSAYAVGIDDHQYPNKSPEFTGKAGGGEISKYVVSQVTGVKADYFVAVDFSGFIKVIDQLGGIDVQVDRTFDDQFYPLDIGASDTCGKSEEELKALTATLSGEKLDQQFTCRYEQLHFDKGLQYLDGATALKYARSRHSLTDGGDFNRSERQRQVLEAVKNKVVSLNFFNKIIPVFNTLSNHVVTDIDLNTMEKLLSRASEFSTYKINSLAITDKNYLKIGKSKDGQSILIPKLGENDFSEIQTFLQSN